MTEPNRPTVSDAVPGAAGAGTVLCIHCDQPLVPIDRHGARQVQCPHCAAVFPADGAPAVAALSLPDWNLPTAGPADGTRPDATAAADTASESDEYLYLVGHTPLGDYLDFMAAEAAGDLARDRRTLAERWRTADDYRRARERDARIRHRQQQQQDRDRQTAGADDGEWFTHVLHRRCGTDGAPAPAPAAANGASAPAHDAAGTPPGVQPLPPELEPLAGRVLADPICRRAFAAVPVRVAWVELDPLVVFQRTVNLEHVRRLQAQLGRRPSPQDVFRFCLPYDHPTPAFRVRALPGRDGNDGTYVFTSESNDLRYLEPTLLRPDQISAYDPLGPVAAVLGLAVGFGSNYLNVIACGGRLVLNNGNHRAYALRDLGFTHAPCLVQEVTRREELSVVGAGRLRRHPDYYLKDPCPPVLADYFDPQMAHRVRLVRRGREVRVTFHVEEVSA